MSDFKPPLNNHFVVKLSQAIVLPCVLWWNQYEIVEVEQELLDIFAALRGKRTVICSNHSHRHDPLILYLLSSVLKEQFNYVAAREIFDWWRGFCGWGLQRHGVYSVTRGVPDRQSLTMTRNLIKSGQRKLVVFPECEISGRNDSLLPVERGLSSLLLHAMEDVQKEQPGEAVYVLPVALRYRYIEDVTPSLSNALLRLERQLGISVFASDDLCGRLAQISKRLLAIIEAQFNFAGTEFRDADSQTAVTSAVDKLLQYCAQSLNYHLPESIDQLEAARLLHVQLDTKQKKREQAMSRYQLRLHRQVYSADVSIYRALETIRRLLALQDFLVVKELSPENLAVGIELVEREVFGRVSQKGRRAVRISCGQPIDLVDYHTDFQANKRLAVDHLSACIMEELSELLGITVVNRSLAA